MSFVVTFLPEIGMAAGILLLAWWCKKRFSSKPHTTPTPSSKQAFNPGTAGNRKRDLRLVMERERQLSEKAQRVVKQSANYPKRRLPSYFKQIY